MTAEQILPCRFPHQITLHSLCDPRGSRSETKGKHRREAQLDERIYQSESCKKTQTWSPRRSLQVGTPKGAKCNPMIHTKRLEEIPLPHLI